ncbi:hypothetical protein DFH08DRAFT_812305 [Mycena albidolilacea]|uniref:Uncharacterized protein n=1 Tax=Mycena albidolilacea TaxID=1033008 RepID=A0AAD6ZUC7_9AGAR|nr:hypothetical protein DFH08DRAFT_812305 [Mycena albidolilacea]
MNDTGTLCTHPDVQHHLNNSKPSLIPTGSLVPEDVGTAQAGQREVGAMKVPAHDRGMRCKCCKGRIRGAARYACNGGVRSSGGGHAFRAEKQRAGRRKQWGAGFASSDRIRMEWQNAGAAAERASGRGRMCGGVREQRQARPSEVLCNAQRQALRGSRKSQDAKDGAGVKVLQRPENRKPRLGLLEVQVTQERRQIRRQKAVYKGENDKLGGETGESRKQIWKYWRGVMSDATRNAHLSTLPLSVRVACQVINDEFQ